MQHLQYGYYKFSASGRQKTATQKSIRPKKRADVATAGAPLSMACRIIQLRILLSGLDSPFVVVFEIARSQRFCRKNESNLRYDFRVYLLRPTINCRGPHEVSLQVAFTALPAKVRPRSMKSKLGVLPDLVNPLKLTLPLVIGVLVIAHISSVSALDCGKASQPIEKLFCATPELKKADAAMSAAYLKLLHDTTDPDFHEALVRSQRRWLEVRSRGVDRFGTAENDKTDIFGKLWTSASRTG